LYLDRNKMKTVVWVLLLFMSVPAISSESVCGSLFTNLPFPKPLPVEDELYREARAVFKLSRDGKVVPFLYTSPPIQKNNLSREQRKRLIKADDAERKMRLLYKYIQTKNLTQEEKTGLENRMVSTATGVVLRTSESLKAMNVNHTIDYQTFPPTILILPTGDHYINKAVSRLKEKYDLDIVIDVMDLIERDSGGSYYYPTKYANHKINLPPYILLEKSIFQYVVLLHELRHFITAREKDIKSYHGWLLTKDSPKSEMYGNGFSIDELVSYRSSLRSISHSAVFAKKDFNYYYDQLKPIVDLEFKLSNAIITTLTKPEESHYVISSKADNSKILETATFANNLFKLVSEHLTSLQNSPRSDKKQFVKNLIKVLTIYNIKKFNGDYPSIYEINKILNESDQ
jgi:hypothetical protein